MQQEDSKTSWSIALDSKKLAEASKRDSSSMKAIAVLTMVFLPSTAVATVFSMGPFWTNEPGSVLSVSSEFWLYWAVTLPLTTVVMVIWQIWLWVYQKRQMRRLKDIEEAAGPAPDEWVGEVIQSRSPSVLGLITHSISNPERGRISRYGTSGNVSMEQHPDYVASQPNLTDKPSFSAKHSLAEQSAQQENSVTIASEEREGLGSESYIVARLSM
ncbi:MAG: hypothetical protein Q9188_006289 [Gyalolechia gomerana]